jgi:hypothetical protein
MIALLGFTALAIDGANVYNDRRKDQSTADSAALAGAGAAAQYLKTAGTSGFDCSTVNTSGTLSYNAASAARTTAVSTATDDNVALANNDLSTKNGVATTCGTSNGVPYIDIHTEVTTTAKTYFLKVITGRPTTTSVETIARVYISSSYAGGNVLVALGQTCDDYGGIYALGNGQISITGGGIYTAGCIEATNSSKIYDYDGIIQYTGASGIITPQNDMVLILNDIDPSTAPNISASLAPQIDWYGPNTRIAASLLPVQATQTLTPLTIPVMVTQDCSSLTTQNPTFDYHNITINPGYYPNGILQGSGALILNSGVYCIAAGKSVDFSQQTVTGKGNVIFYFQGAGNFTVEGACVLSMVSGSIYLTNGNFNVGSGSSFSAQNITMYIKQGDFTIDGGAKTVSLNSPGCSNSSCGVGPAIPGVLLYMDKTNTGKIKVDNGPNPTLNGTMYAPNALATFSGGTATNTLNVQLIAKRIQVDQGAYLTMNVDKATLYSQGSVTIELLK